MFSCGARGSTPTSVADHGGHCGGRPQSRGPRVACGRRAERGRNALYELAHQDPADPRPLGPAARPQDELDDRECRLQPQCHSGERIRYRRRCGVLRIADYDGIEKKVRERIKKKLIEDTAVEMTFEQQRPPLEVVAGRARPRQARAVDLCRDRQDADDRRRRRRRRHRRGLRGARHQGAGAGALRACRLRFPLERCRVHRCQFDRAAAVPPDPHDHGRIVQESELRRAQRLGRLRHSASIQIEVVPPRFNACSAPFPSPQVSST